ncbi:MAG: hypothetical protein ACE5IR_10170 [bacterium]
MLRLFIIGLLFYFGYKILTGLTGISDSKKQKVQGSRKGNPPLDLGNHEVEDADFEDID